MDVSVTQAATFVHFIRIRSKLEIVVKWKRTIRVVMSRWYLDLGIIRRIRLACNKTPDLVACIVDPGLNTRKVSTSLGPKQAR